MSLWTAAWITVTLSLCCLGQTQEVYEAEEHSNVTLTWIFPVNTDMQPQSLTVSIIHVETQWGIYFYDSMIMDKGHPDEHYRGRLHCDPQLAFNIRIGCVLTNLSLRDAGTYKCAIRSDRKRESKLCHLNVTAASKPPENEPPRPASRERTALYVVLVLFTVVTAALCGCHFNIFSTSSIRTTTSFI